MFSFFKKKESSNQRNGENAVTNTEEWNGFPSAEEIREKSISAWKDMTIEEILIAIDKESEKGWESVDLFRVNISEEIIKGLEEKGYTVKKDMICNVPRYTIKW